MMAIGAQGCTSSPSSATVVVTVPGCWRKNRGVGDRLIERGDLCGRASIRARNRQFLWPRASPHTRHAYSSGDRRSFAACTRSRATFRLATASSRARGCQFGFDASNRSNRSTSTTAAARSASAVATSDCAATTCASACLTSSARAPVCNGRNCVLACAVGFARFSDSRYQRTLSERGQ